MQLKERKRCLSFHGLFLNEKSLFPGLVCNLATSGAWKIRGRTGRPAGCCWKNDDTAQ